MLENTWQGRACTHCLCLPIESYRINAGNQRQRQNRIELTPEINLVLVDWLYSSSLQPKSLKPELTMTILTSDVNSRLLSCCCPAATGSVLTQLTLTGHHDRCNPRREIRQLKSLLLVTVSHTKRAAVMLRFSDSGTVAVTWTFFGSDLALD